MSKINPYPFYFQAGKYAYPPVENLLLGLALIVVIVVTGSLSFVQELKTAGLAKSRKRLLGPTFARVIREGEELDVPSEELVAGDIILLQAGDEIPADCRMLEVNNFLVDASSLTGESEPIERDIHCTDDDLLLTKNMAFKSAFVVQGTARAVVTGV